MTRMTGFFHLQDISTIFNITLTRSHLHSTSNLTKGLGPNFMGPYDLCYAILTLIDLKKYSHLLLQSLVSALFGHHQRPFLMQQMGKDRDTHSQTLCRE